MGLLDDAQGWMSQQGLDKGKLEQMAKENTPEAKDKLMEFAKEHGVDVNPEDDAQAIWNKVKTSL